MDASIEKGIGAFMSIASELQKLATNKANIKAAIELKSPAIAPTGDMSKWASSIMSIPSVSGWSPPSDWPDLHEILERYPKGDDAHNLALAVLFDLSVNRKIMLTNCTQVRYSDDPDTVQTGTLTGKVTHTFADDGTRYGWIVAYITSSESVYANVTLGNGIATVLPGTENSYCPIGVLWASGKNGRSVAGAYDCKSIQCIDTVDGVAISNTYNNSYNGTTHLRAFRVKNAVKSTTTLLRNAFAGCYMLTDIDTSDWDTSGVTSFSGSFSGCGMLRSIDISGWDASNAADFSLFNTTTALETLIGNKSFSDLSIDSTKGPKVTFQLSYSPFLSVDSLRFIVNWIGTVTSATNLVLGPANLAKLTAEEKAIATAKGWTLS